MIAFIWEDLKVYVQTFLLPSVMSRVSNELRATLKLVLSIGSVFNNPNLIGHYYITIWVKL